MTFFYKLGLSIIEFKYKKFVDKLLNNEDVKHYRETFKVDKMTLIEEHFMHFKSIIEFEKEPSAKAIHHLLPHLINVSVYPNEPSVLFYYMMQYGALNLSSLVSSVDKYEFDTNKYITVKNNDVLHWSMHHNFLLFLDSQDLDYLMNQKEMLKWIKNSNWTHSFLQASSQQISSLSRSEAQKFKQHIVENILFPFSQKGLNVEAELNNSYFDDVFGFNLAKELKRFQINQEHKYLEQNVLFAQLSTKKQKL